MHNNRSLLVKLGVYLALYAATIGIVLATSLDTDYGRLDIPLLRMTIVFFATILLTKYFFYMTLSPWYDVVEEYKKFKFSKSRRATNYAPLVSVMIPAWNEEVNILETIGSVLKSNYRNVEIVVVNDGSTDKSDALIRSFLVEHEAESAKLPVKERISIAYFYQENGGKGAALNRCVKESHGDILMSIDADCVVMPDTVQNFVEEFKDPVVMAAVGNVKIGNTNTLLGVIQYLEFLFSFYFKKADSLMNTIYIIGGAAGAFRREVFDKIGLYSTKNITEDIHLSVRIQAAGMKIVYAANALVYTEGATDMAGLMKQRLRWKHGRFETFYEFRKLFFSTKKGHSRFLSFVILPLALFSDFQLFLEPFFLVFLYIYSYTVQDFSSFISGILVVGSMFFVQIFFDNSKRQRASFYFLAPIGWLLFYLSTFVECSALAKSLWAMARGKRIKWQRWQRNGVLNS